MPDFGRKSGNDLITTNRLLIMDVYAKRKGGWIQAASHTVIDPTWRAEQAAKPANLSPRPGKRFGDRGSAMTGRSLRRCFLTKLLP